MEATEKIWMNGELVDWDDAKVHVGVHGLHYGSGVFEGVRCYETPKGPAVFRLADHMQRLHDSARLLYMDIPFSVEDLREATHDLPPVTSGRSPSTATDSSASRPRATPSRR
jgi:branched-chain amino acid aminotransferase